MLLGFIQQSTVTAPVPGGSGRPVGRLLPLPSMQGGWARCTFTALSSRQQCIWYPAAGRPRRLAQHVAPEDGWIAWSPASDALLVHTDKTVVTMFSPQGQPLAPAQKLGFNAMFGVWGPYGVAIASAQQVRLYSVVGHALVLQHKVPADVATRHAQHHLCSPATPNQVLSFSASSSHLLVTRQTGLAIVTFATGAKRDWPLEMHGNDVVCWASEGVVVHKGLPSMSEVDSDEEFVGMERNPFDWPDIAATFLSFE